MERIKKFSLITLFGPINMLNKNPLTKRSNKISSTSTPNKNKIPSSLHLKVERCCYFYLVMSKLNVRRIRDILHESIVTIEQITLNVDRGKLRFVKVIRQPKQTQIYHHRSIKHKTKTLHSQNKIIILYPEQHPL